jgi:hypothetical protein
MRAGGEDRAMIGREGDFERIIRSGAAVAETLAA